MIPQHYDPARYLDALENGYDRLAKMRIAVEAMLETMREESERLSGLDVFKDCDILKEWETKRKGNSIWESPIGSMN